MPIFILFAVLWYVGLFHQTFFHHRYSAHGMFRMNKFWERFFYVTSFIFMGSSYLSPYAYGVMHRLHHSYADTEKDVHSPKYDKNPLAMMWRTKKIYTDIFFGRRTYDDKYYKNVPNWRAFDIFAGNWVSRLSWVGFYFWFYWYFGAELWMYLILMPVQILMGPVHGVIINWYAHKYGYVNFPVNDTSKNLMPLDLFMMGEGYHNNHHKFGGRANFAVKWWEFDPVYPFIKAFDKLGIISLKRQTLENQLKPF